MPNALRSLAPRLAPLLLALAALLLTPAVSRPASQPAALPPDLVTLPPSDLRIDRRGGRVQLRFTNKVANVGRGPLELDGRVDPQTGETVAHQRLYHDDGSVERFEVGRFVFDDHRDHDHWHFDEFASYELWTVGGDGKPGERVAGNLKVTFCLMDSAPLPGFEAPAAGPRYGCGRELQGISVGWMDIYSHVLRGQEIDLDGVPDGDYWLISRADPGKRLREATRDNNDAAIRLRLSDDRQRVEVLRDPG